MAMKFNSGRGAAVCDWCGSMLVDGDRVVRTHRVLAAASAVQRHYCGAGCMETHAVEDRGLHRELVIVLAQESARLRMIEVVCADPLAKAAALDRMQRLLVSREVKAPRDET
jgi:hypothetical protein